MTYKEKVAHAESVVKELLSKKSKEQIEIELKAKGLFDRDVGNIMASVKNILGDKFRPRIRALLLEKKSVVNAPEFDMLGADILNTLAEREFKAIQNEEKKKVTMMLKEGKTVNEIAPHIQLHFYPLENIEHQYDTYTKVKHENSGTGSMINIVGGLLLMALGGSISLISMKSGSGGRLFYGLIVVGLVMLVKGMTTTQNPYDT